MVLVLVLLTRRNNSFRVYEIDLLITSRIVHILHLPVQCI